MEPCSRIRALHPDNFVIPLAGTGSNSSHWQFIQVINNARKSALIGFIQITLIVINCNSLARPGSKPFHSAFYSV
jgi:hypothetical protein